MGTDVGAMDGTTCKRKQWITPLLKQCFVTTGVSLNMSASGLVIGFGAALLGQLRAPGSDIPIDESSGTWLASLPACFMFAGNFLVIPIMGKYGRRTANLVSITLLTFAWTCILFAPSIIFLLVARALQGTYMGMSTALGSLLIGEYTSPKNRGAFLMTISVSISVGVLAVHSFSSFTSWRISAMICAVIAVIDLCIVILSPESPSWLASQGRYEDSKRVFRWLRGDTEEDELRKMIAASIVVRESKLKSEDNSLLDKFKKNVIYLKESVQKKEFYKPLIIMCHIYLLAMWSGLNILVVYFEDFIHATVGDDVNVPYWMITLDVQRIVSNILAIYVVKRMRRRTMLFTTASIDVAALLAISAYSYAKTHYTLPFDHALIGIILSHLMMFAIASGTLSLSFIIAGEIFPLEFKTLAGGISILMYSASLFIALKTTPYWFAIIGIHGTCLLSALVLSYCLWVAWLLLPETKDRTLQDIEDEFRGKPLIQDAESKGKNSVI